MTGSRSSVMKPCLYCPKSLHDTAPTNRPEGSNDLLYSQRELDVDAARLKAEDLRQAVLANGGFAEVA